MVETTPLVVRENSVGQDARDLAKKDALLASTEMAPVQGTVDVDVPAGVLWEAFRHADWWPRWNKCFFWARNRDLKLGDKLVWAFEPIRPWYLYKMFAVANIVELEPGRKVTWEVTAMPGFYARHTYHVEDLGGGRSRFGSWEQAMGPQARFPLTKKFWVAHFTFVKDRSLEGAKTLEAIYKRDGKITKDRLKPRRYWKFWLAVLLLLLLLAAGALALWFYRAYLRPERVALAPGVEVITAGGGNSLVVRDGADTLLVDTKFPPASGWLSRRLSDDAPAPNLVVNTHYHYDHTQGNTDYPGAKIYAYRTVPDLMRRFDNDWWKDHAAGIPTQLVDGEGRVRVGGQEVVLTHPGPAHTRGDLWAYLRRGDKEIVATGDLVFHTYYPFMDLGEGGMDIAGLINAVRTMASRHPNAVFVPGHGPVAAAADLNRYADYLQALNDEVARARAAGMTEDEAASRIDLSRWNLRKLPSSHGRHLCWATAEMNVRWVYQLQAGTREPREDCTF
ncbi:MAG: MBL fold metallo-hydrolase [Acidobacteriota bacterium]|nr:MBL fold metallo-hydrolase [Acidobacteriota bacterium]